MDENILFKSLMFLPLIKLDKMSRIDPETDAELEFQNADEEKQES